jgi:glycosyltransferase involved in cell wall biosynthesis
MRRLIFATQKLDPLDPVLADTVAKVRALAERLDELVVLCDAAEPEAALPNVRVHEFGGGTQLGRGARFVSALARELRPRPLGLVAHMVPLYVLVAAPFVRPLRIPLVLWYSHPNGHVLVRSAEALSTAVLSVENGTFPISSKKLVPIGHGIDLAAFPCTPSRGDDGTLRILMLGRYSPIKAIDCVIRAASLVGREGASVSLEAHGAVGPFEAHRRDLAELAHQLGVDVRLEAEISPAQVLDAFSRSDVLVNATKGVTADKVVFEAAAACVPVIASSPAFAGLLPPELRFEDGRADDLAARLLALDRRRRPELREAVSREHSVEHWADGVLAAVEAR